jgi:diguanylate cyclase (GGDEF)-like protein
VETTAPVRRKSRGAAPALDQIGSGVLGVARALIEPRSIILLLLVGIASGAAARLSLEVVLQPANVAAVWLPSGIAVGALLVTHPRRWPLILAGVAAAVAAANLTAGRSPALAAGFAVANVVEPLLAALLLRRAGFVSLGSLRDVGRFVGIAAVAAPAVGASIGAAITVGATGAPPVPAWIIYVLAHGGGVLAIAPLLLVVRLPASLPPVRWAVAAEAAALAGALLSLAALSFLTITPGLQIAAYPAFLLLVLAAVRFGLLGAALATSAVSLIALAGTVAGLGPIAHLNSNPIVQIGQAQIFVAAAFLTSFVTAAAMSERRAAAAALAEQMQIEAARAAMSERLTAFARDISRSLEQESLFQHIVHAAAEVVHADIVQLTVASPDDGTHRVVAAVGAPNVIGRVVAPGQGITGAIIRDGLPVTVARQDPDDRPTGWRDVISENHLAVTGSPIIRDGSVVATLVLARLDLESPFRADEARALTMMCSLSALALANAVEFGLVHERSVSDELTGVPNRRYFNMAFQQLAAQRLRQAPETRLPVSAVIFDLDHFGALNKERGHATGDIVLRAFGSILANRLRRADVVARYGGEEFVALLVGTDREDAVRVADDVRRTFGTGQMTGADGDPIRCTVSAGVAAIGPEDASLEHLLGTADVALAMAKRAGRDQVASA